MSFQTPPPPQHGLRAQKSDIPTFKMESHSHFNPQFSLVADRSVEIVGEGGQELRHQGHRVARKHASAAARCAREISFENNISGGAAVYKSGPTGPCHGKVLNGSRGALSSGKGLGGC